MPKQISLNREIYKWDSLEHFYANKDGEDLLELAMFYTTHDLLEMEVKLIEDKVTEDQTIDIETINAYKLIEAPYMAECLRGNQFDKFAELLKQSELEIVDKVNMLVDAVKHLNKEIQSIKK